MIARGLKIALALALVAATWRVASRFGAIEAMRAGGPQALETALRRDPTQPGTHFRLGLTRLTDAGSAGGAGVEAALPALEEAVRLNPWSWRYRYELGRAYELAGRYDDAERGFLAAVEISPSSASYRWRLANFYVRRGAVDRALPHLEVAFAQDYALLAPGFALLRDLGHRASIPEVWPTDPPGLLALLGLACGEGPGEATDRLVLETWDLLDPGSVSLLEGGAVVDCLVSRGLHQQARQAWVEIARAHDSRDADFEQGAVMVWNAGFELPLGGNGLGWRTYEVPGTSLQITGEGCRDRGHCPLLVFDGTANPEALGLEQRLLLTEGTYLLSFFARGEGITSDEGVAVEIVDVRRGEVVARTTPLVGTFAWRREEASFALPAGSGEAILRLSRRKSLRIDSAIGGKVWLDQFEIRRAER